MISRQGVWLQKQFLTLHGCKWYMTRNGGLFSNPLVLFGETKPFLRMQGEKDVVCFSVEDHLQKGEKHVTTHEEAARST